MKKRKAYIFRIPSTRLDVYVTDSATPGLLIQDCSGTDEISGPYTFFAITHKTSGFFVRRDFDDVEDARYIAGALGGLPIDWTVPAKELYASFTKLDPIAFMLLLELTRHGKTLKPNETYDSVRGDMETVSRDFDGWVRRTRAGIARGQA